MTRKVTSNKMNKMISPSGRMAELLLKLLSRTGHNIIGINAPKESSVPPK